MRFKGAVLAATAVLISGSTTAVAPALASENAHASRFPAWKVTWSGPNAGLDGVAAASKNDAWAIGVKKPGVAYLLHWGGKRWLPKPLPSKHFDPFAVAASSPTNVWLYGSFGLAGGAFRWDGSHWHQMPSGGEGGANEALVVLSPSNVWLAYYTCDSSGPCMFHWDGSTWTSIKVPAHFRFTGLSGSSASSVWMAGTIEKNLNAGTGVAAAFRWVHNSWSRVRLPNLGRAARVQVAAPGPSNVWIATLAQPARVAHWNGKRWHLLPNAPEPSLIMAPFGSTGLRLGAASLWNGHSWQVGPDLFDGNAMTAIPGTKSAWMVGAWPAKKTGLTAQVRFSP
jgi:hypothetical protein